MGIYRNVCYKVENFFIKRMSKTENDLKVNMQKAEIFRENKEQAKIEKKNSKIEKKNSKKKVKQAA